MYVLHYLLIGAWSGAADQLIAGVNAALGYFADLHPLLKRVHNVYAVVYIPLAYLTVNELWDVLPLSSSMIAFFAMRQTSAVRIRIFAICYQLPWLPYSLHIQSSATLIQVVIYIAMLLFNIFKDTAWSSSKASKD
mmetsp:Transcript_71018/g.151948  ORF Transcript_71018/g.151948 Transcript_71018/m.151948 type:complete len:136 (-) Transcript_71018:35-442(-)